MSTQAKLRYTLEMSLRLKVGAYVAVLVGGLLALTGFVQVRGERKIFLQETLSRNTVLLKALAIPCAIAIANNEDTTLDNYVAQFGEGAGGMDLRELAILAHDGRVLAHTDAREFGKIYDDPFTHRSRRTDEPIHALDEDAGRLEIAVPVESAGLRWGTLRASFTLAGVEHAMARSQTRIVWTSIGISLGLSLLAYFVLSFLWVQPVVRMETMARRVGRGDLDARVEVTSRDELGRLALQLNSMA
ncbi:MAG: HAMP domain-containing protein, partial [Deltaproteobacteria bacterium]|nr:HAMP domain-containing protein [Deltaproteobacteria bacterium]